MTANCDVGEPVEPPVGGYSQQEREDWQAGVNLAVCFIDGCDYLDIDQRGPVFIRNDRTPYYACVEHWEAIIGILGRQASSNDEARWSAPNEVTR